MNLQQEMMNFREAVRLCFSNYINADGRAPRWEYWYWVLFVLIVNVIMEVLFPAPLIGLVSLALAPPGICVGIRRLHDLGKTGWWILFIMIPVIGWIVGIYWFVHKGDDGQNAYGADPLTAQSRAPVQFGI